MDTEAGGEQRELAGHGYAGALGHHQEEDSERAQLCDE